jgi:hypothetical protein
MKANGTAALAALLCAAAFGACKMPIITQDMLKSAKDTSGLSVEPGNRRVVVTWTADPTAAAYTLYYTKNGGLPSETNGIAIANAQSPLSIAGLANGDDHEFVLKARYSSGETKTLGPVSAIPLSPATLAPKVVGELGQIAVSWNPIRGADTFEVWRSRSASGSFENISGPVRDTSWADTSVSEGELYYYSVKPQSSGTEQLSLPNSGVSPPFEIARLPLIGSIPSSNAVKVIVRDRYAYVLNGATIDLVNNTVSFDGSLEIVDIADRAKPRLVGRLALPDAHPMDIVLSPDGRFAYIASGAVVLEYYPKNRGALLVVDVSEPSGPRLVKTFLGEGTSAMYNPTALALAKSGTRLYMAVSGTYCPYAANTIEVAHFRAIDVTEPAAPSLLFASSAGANLNSQSSLPGLVLSADETWLFAPESTMTVAKGLVAVQVGTASFEAPATALAPGGTGYPAAWLSSWGFSAVARSGAWLYIGTPYGLLIADATSPAAPVIKGSVATPRKINSIAARASSLFLGCSDQNGVGVSELVAATAGSDGTAQIKSRRSMAGARSALAAPDGRSLLVADGTGGLQILDAAAAGLPNYIGSCSLPLATGTSSALALSGDIACVVSWPDGENAVPSLALVDISDPRAPRHRSSIRLEANTALYSSGARRFNLDTCGSLLYYSASYKGIGVVDIGDPDYPRTLGFLSLGDYQVNRIEATGPNLLLATDIGLVAIDVADPAAPRLRVGLPPPGTGCADLALSGDLAFVSDKTAGLAVYDLSSLFIDGSRIDAPRCIGSTAAFQGRGLRISGDSAFVHDATPGSGGLYSFDLTAPAQPARRGTYASVATPKELQNLGGYVFCGTLSGPNLWDSNEEGILPIGAISVSNGVLTYAQGRGRYLYATTSGGSFEVLDLLE